MPLTWSSAAQQFTNVSVSTASVYYGSTLSFSVSTQGFANGGIVYYSTTGTAGVQTDGTAVVSNYFGDLGRATIPVSTTRTLSTGSFAVNFYQGSISGNQISNYNFSAGALSPDSFFTATSLLISSAGPGPTALTDLSGNNTSTTVVGTPQVRSFIPFTTPGISSSMFFNGNDSLSIPQSTCATFGTDAFTVELWLYMTTNSVNQGVLYAAQGAGAFNILFTTVSGLMWGIYGNPSFTFCTAANLPLNQWFHLAVSRVSTAANQTFGYINGALVVTATDTNNYTVTGMLVGYDGISSRLTNGYISNLRMIKGLAVYTGAFTRPTIPLQLTQAAGTSTAAVTTQTVLLLLQAPQATNNNSFYDSANTFTQIGYKGSPIQGTFSPYSKYATYFPASASIITNPNANFSFGTGQFTIELWLYLSATPTANTQIAGVQSTGGVALYIASNGTLSINLNGTGDILTSSYTPPIKTWVHLAVARNNSNAIGIFAAGARIASTTLGTSFTGSTGFKVGGFGECYVANVRVTKGSFLYDAGSASPYTPPSLLTPLTPTAETVLIACQGPYSSTSTDYSTFINTMSYSVGVAARPISTTTFLTTPYSTSTIAGSIYFNGTSDVVTSTNATSVNFGTSNFTVECWVYIPSYSTGDANEKQLIEAVQSGGAFQLYITGGGSGLRWGVNGVNGNIILPAGLIPVAQWFHVAVSRTGTGANQTFGFINGVLTISATDNNTYSQVGFGIGASRAGANYFAGYISGIRIVNGYAMYGSAFSPSLTPPTASLTGTTTIINGNGSAIYDATGNNNIMTTGTSIISTATVKFSGNSIQLLGTSYLNVISTTGTSFGSIIGTADFTAEMWIYPTNVTGSFYLMTIGTESAGRYSIFLVNGVLTTNMFTVGSNVTMGGSIGANNWTHIAVARQGSTIRGFINGVLLGTTDSNSGSIGNSNIIKVGSDASGANSTTFQGFMSDVRLTRGVARYTASFTSATTYSPLV